ncbi:phosphate acetyltransferase [Dermatophilaceae bacterium Soc4.6]
MATSLYLASAEGFSGKSAVALGLLDQLSRRVGRVGVFRPIVRTDDPAADHVLALLLSRLGTGLTAADAAGVCYDDLHHDPDRAMGTVVDRFHALARTCDVVLVVGSDYTDVATPTEFSTNATIAANLDAPMVLVVTGAGRTPEQIATAAVVTVDDARAHHATILAVVANRVAPVILSSTADRLNEALGGLAAYALPADPVLDSPTVRELSAAVGGRLLHGDDALLDREATGLVVAAMTMPNALERLVEGCVVVSPADRGDMLLGLLMAHGSRTFPSPSGILLNGGFDLPAPVARLVDGLDVHVPVIACDTGTMQTTALLSAVTSRLTRTATRKIETALALVEQHLDVPGLLDRLDVAPTTVVTPLMFEHRLLDRAREADRHIVLPEGEEPRILAAADQLLRRKVVRLTLLGDPELIAARAGQLGLDLAGATLLDPHDPRDDRLRTRFAEEYAAARAHKGVTAEQAWDAVGDISCFGTMMVRDGLADGMVSGSVHTTAHTIRPALEMLRSAGGGVVSSVFFMCLADRVLVYGDCAVNPDPTAEQLAEIAVSSAATARQFGVEPRIAMLSYSTGGSGTGADVEKVRSATVLVRQRAPDLSVEGPIQYDAAVDEAVAAAKLKDSAVAGRATVLIFPDLNTGNNTYKAVQRSAGAVAIGPVLQGLRRPVNDLSRGALVRDIVNTVAITAVQAAAPAEPPTPAAAGAPT